MSDQKPEAEAVAWRYVPSEVWGSQVLTQDPRNVALAIKMGREVEPLYTRATLDAAIAEAVAKERERCARLVETQDTYGDRVEGWFDMLAAAIRTAQERT